MMYLMYIKYKTNTAYINFPMALKTGKEAQELKLSTKMSLDCTGKITFQERTMRELK